ncbi:MAG TPA: ferredoxin [Ramlibacter sp.]|nr:ferredoxin [Ramlibacter sp.]
MPQELAPGTFRIVIHPDKCIGAGHCVAAAPDLFSQNEDDGVVMLLHECPTEDRRADVENAIRLCPTGVIEIAK